MTHGVSRLKLVYAGDRLKRGAGARVVTCTAPSPPSNLP